MRTSRKLPRDMCTTEMYFFFAFINEFNMYFDLHPYNIIYFTTDLRITDQVSELGTQPSENGNKHICSNLSDLEKGL